MNISRVEGFPLRLERTDPEQARGTAGSPSPLTVGPARYRWSTTVPAVYSDHFETTLVRVELDSGAVGWGESQAPVAPRVTAVIIEDLLAPLINGEPFDGSRGSIEHLWSLMFQAMRVRGHTGGFLMDAIAGIDLALWDLAGLTQRLPVASLINPGAFKLAPAYLSGLPSGAAFDPAFQLVKLFHGGTESELLSQLDHLRSQHPNLRLAVDCLWRLNWPDSRAFLDELAARNLEWIEAPFAPDDLEAHQACLDRYPVALGESYRTRFEMGWFGDRIRYLQPDLGRAGITETLRIAAAYPAAPVVPHVSIALGPQLAAAIHTAAALGSPWCEYNPSVVEMANRFTTPPISCWQGSYQVPSGPGLGIAIDETQIRALAAP